MKIRPWNFFTCVGLVFNIMCLFFMWSSLEKRCTNHDDASSLLVATNDNHKYSDSRVNQLTYNKLIEIEADKQILSNYITIMLPEFELFEHDLEKTIETLHSLFKATPVLLVTDRVLYPPIKIKGHVEILNLKPGPEVDRQDSNLDNFIRTEYVLALPDAVRFSSIQQIHNMLKFHLEHPDDITAVKVVGETPKCFSLSVNLKQWTLEYAEKPSDLICDALEGNFALLLPKKLLIQKLAYPFHRPFPYALFIQTTLRNIKVHILESEILQQGKALFLDPHNKWKHKSLDQQRKEKLYQEFGIKKVTLLDGSKTAWYGCNKETPRCFGTIINDMPEYLFRGRWTPPCCLENLRQTARHVFETLDKCKVNYWLEGGSLLGAARNGDIIPWDYDVDLGIYKEDINKCEALKHSQRRPYIDSQQFVWQKAIEGDFFRVQFSEINHLHVDIFPFYSKNGIMTKDFWFKTHRQDMEFPETYLKPLTRINFVGWPALAPNNIPQFLELKFGKGVIENLQYPVPEMLQFAGTPNRTVHF